MASNLHDIPADSEFGRALLQQAYSSLMSRFDKARFQTGSVALQRFVNGKPSSPVVLYASKLDEGNVLEIAIEPVRLAAAFDKPEPAVWKWLEHVHGALIAAKPKTTEKYPVLGSSLKLTWTLFSQVGSPSEEGGKIQQRVHQRKPSLHRCKYPSWQKQPPTKDSISRQ